MAKRFFIIDGMSQIFRCYYAPFQQLTAPSGEPTRATYVFTMMLLQLAREQKPDYLAMAMDSREEDVFRREIASDYKANREAPPEDLAPQIERILQIVRGQRIPIIELPGYEADDVIATLCRRLCDERDIEICLVSKDKDMDQLLSDCVRMFDPGKNEFIGPAELREKKGYGPEHAIEVQTLTGDSTDNIAGVRGVGPKKAAALIAKYGSAAEVVAHADELTPAMRENVKAFADRLEQTRRLVTLRQDVPVEFDLEACRWNGVDVDALHAVANELGFRRLVEQLAKEHGPREAAPPPTPPPPRRQPMTGAQGELFDAPEDDGSANAETPTAAEVARAAAAAPAYDYVLVDNPEKLQRFVAELARQPVFAFDTETTHVNPAWARLAGLSFSWEAGRGYYLPICGIGDCLELEPALDALRPIFADASIRKVGQNLKYDLSVLLHHGVEVAGVAFDTMIASFVLDSSRRSHGMDALARDVLGRETTPITALIGTGRDQITFEGVDTGRACAYSGEDADVTWQLWEVFSRQLAGTDLEALFRDTEMPLVEVLAAMESEGVKLDTGVLQQMSAELESRMRELTGRIHELVGRPFNIDSTKQLATVLYDELGLPVIKKTKTGRSTDAETLDALAAETDHPVLRCIREYRELTKLKGTYIDTLPTMICPRTGRVHASFHQTAAITGRLSSSDPNLQNIPIRTELGRQIRRAFVARDHDHLLVTADYSQIELRVLAHFCRDEALRQAFAEDRDIHQFVAAQVFGVPLEQVTREQRGRAKAVNFGIVYGQTAHGLSRTTGMSVSEAQRFIDMYFLRYPGIRLFIDQTIADARRIGHVRTMLGRRRAVPDINSRNRNLRFQAERLAVNTVIQGSAADLIKRAMINIHRRIREEKRPARMLIQVHDELVFDVPRDGVEAEAEFIRSEMQNALPLDVPVKVDLAWGDNWLEGK